MANRGIFDLSGKVALITGASRGLGRAFAEAMAEFGADVACVGRDEAKLAETVQLIGKYKHRAIAIKADVTKETEVKNMVAERSDSWAKSISFSITPASPGRRVRIHETPTEEWDAVINTNLRGRVPGVEIRACGHGEKQERLHHQYFLYCRPPRRGAGGRPGRYGAAKAGVILLTQVAAMEYAKDGIRVNCIAPGMHKSELGRNNPGPKPANMPDMEKMMEHTAPRKSPWGASRKPASLKGWPSCWPPMPPAISPARSSSRTAVSPPGFRLSSSPNTEIISWTGCKNT